MGSAVKEILQYRQTDKKTDRETAIQTDNLPVTVKCKDNLLFYEQKENLQKKNSKMRQVSKLIRQWPMK